MKSRNLALVLTFLLLWATGSPLAAQKNSRDEIAAMRAELKKLRVERVDVAERSKESCESAWNAGAIVIETYLNAIDSLTIARVEAADTSQSRIHALDERVNTLRAIEARLRDHCEIQTYARELVSMQLKSAEVASLEEKLLAATEGKASK
jgi:hypothetical protein